MKLKHKSIVAKSVSIAALAGAAAIAFPTAGSAQVTFERLLDPEPENWLIYGGDYNGWRYSELDQINRDNVGDLEVKYIFSILGESNSTTLGDTEESVILADNGTLYMADGLHRVYAFDASSGNEAVPLWMYDPAITKSRTARGVALFDDGVFVGTNDTRLIRVNASSGEAVWETVATAAPVEPYGTPSPDTQGFTTEPIVVHTAGGRNVIAQGESTGGQRGTISYIVAADADTGELIWRWYAVPFPGEPGHETWECDWGCWKTGGAGVWSHATFDPATNLIYHGTGDAFPTFDPEFRPGDNLYASSTVALDADTGDLVWYFQHVPNESWDFDQPSTRMLYDSADGVPTAGIFARSGHYYQFDRVTGTFTSAAQFVTTVNWTAGIDEKTGMPVDYVPGAGVQRYAGVTPTRGEQTGDSCPTWSNAPAGLNPPSFDPVRRVAYIQIADGCLGGAMLSAWPDIDESRAADGLNRIGQGAGASVQRQSPAISPVYALIGLNVDTGERVSYYSDANEPALAQTGTLSTAGDILVAGTGTGDVQIFDADTLENIWTFHVGAELAAPFSTWAVDGKQYIGVIVGGNGNGAYQQAAFAVVWGLRD